MARLAVDPIAPLQGDRAARLDEPCVQGEQHPPRPFGRLRDLAGERPVFYIRQTTGCPEFSAFPQGKRLSGVAENASGCP